MWFALFHDSDSGTQRVINTRKRRSRSDGKMSSNSRTETDTDITDLFTCGVCKVCKFGTAEELCNHKRSCDGLFKEIFTCDACHEEFDSFDEAVQHEKQCGDKNIVNKPNTNNKTVYITSSGDEHEMSETENVKSTHARQQDENKLSDGFCKEEFTCDVCNIAQFDTMEEAIEHENRCIIIQKNGPHNSRSSISGDENSTSERTKERPSVVQNGNDCVADTTILNQSTQWQQPDKCAMENEDTIRVVIPPGRIGLLLKLDKKFGGALITKVEENSTTGAAVHVGDRIVSIDNHKIVRVADYSINHDKTRTLEVAILRARQKFHWSPKHNLFTLEPPCSSICNEKSLIEHSSVAFPQSNMVKSTAQQTYGCKEKGKQSFLRNYLHPVEIPFDPLDECFDNSLERELAWLVEESAIIAPQLTQNPIPQLFILD